MPVARQLLRGSLIVLFALAVLGHTELLPTSRAWADDPDSKPFGRPIVKPCLPPDKNAQALPHFAQAQFYLFHWQLKLAELELEEAIARRPKFPAAHRDLSLVSFFRMNPMKGLAEMMVVVGLGDPVPYTPAEIANLDRRALKAHYQRGLAEGQQGRWRDAKAEFQWALTYGPNDYAIHRSLAFAYANLDSFDQAEAEYGRTFALNPNDAFSHADFAGLLSDKGRLLKATDEMQQAVKLAPSAAALHVDLGWLAEAQGDLPTARQEFQKAIDLSPHHAGLWVHLGRILEHLGKPDQAINAYTRALAIDPDQSDARSRLCQLKSQASS